MRCAAGLALLFVISQGCGSGSADGGAAGGESAGPSPAPATGSTGGPPSTSTDEPPSPSADAGPDSGASSRARCGAQPYDWIVSPALGDVLESDSSASHTPLELTYALIEAKNAGAMKTKRYAKHGTKSKVLRYQTQDRGKLVDATTLVAYPDASSAKTFPILLVLHGTAGFTDACSPSKGVADDALGGFADGVGILVSIFASLGYVAVAPDYIGLKSMGAPTGFMHPYLVGEPTAIASLDAVRAAKKSLAGSNVTPGDVVVMGGSQGGHAAAFVNRFSPHYAPELVIKGSVWDVPPTDLLGQAKPALAATTNATKNMIAATAALESWYAASKTGLAAAFLAPYDKDVPTALTSGCSPGDVLKGATRETIFTPAYLSPSGPPSPFDCYLAENSLPTTSVPMLDSVPSMFLLGENDELVDNVVERASFQKLCAQGLALSYLECKGASHVAPLTYAFDQWLDFLEDRLAGKALSGTCTIKPPETCTSTP
jgi:dienelactone hydrolase